MVRIQVQLTENQILALRKLSASTGRSIADLVREGVDHRLGTRIQPSDNALRRRALKALGRFTSGAKDIGERHDHYLAQAFRR